MCSNKTPEAEYTSWPSILTYRYVDFTGTRKQRHEQPSLFSVFISTVRPTLHEYEMTAGWIPLGSLGNISEFVV